MKSSRRTYYNKVFLIILIIINVFIHSVLRMKQVFSWLLSTCSCFVPILSFPFILFSIFHNPINKLEPPSSPSPFSVYHPFIASTSKHPLLIYCPSQFLFVITMVFNIFHNLLILFDNSSLNRYWNLLYNILYNCKQYRIIRYTITVSIKIIRIIEII